MQTGLSINHYGNINHPILFMVHPAGTLHTVWLSLIDHLQYDYHIIAPDLCYQDWSSVTFMSLVSDLAEIIPTNKPIHAVGMGLGGDLLLSLAMTHPHKLDSLTLVDTLLDDTMRRCPPISLPLMRLFRCLPDAVLRYCLLSGMHYMDADTLEAIKADMVYLGKEGIFAQLNVYNTYHLTHPLESVTIPTLLFYGGLLHPMYLLDANRLHHELPCSRLHIVSRADQGACFYDADTFIAMLHDHIHSVSVPEPSITRHPMVTT